MKIDVVILSNATNEVKQGITLNCIYSLFESEIGNNVNFNVIVIETNCNVKYKIKYDIKVIYPGIKFGFNKFLNIGIAKCKSEYICLCNNDLIFSKNWASTMLNYFKSDHELFSANPACNIFHKNLLAHNSDKYVYANSKNIFDGIFTGWCILVKRSIFKIIGKLDENIIFWYADRDFAQLLLKYNLKHILILDSIVTHIGNSSHDTINKYKLIKYTAAQEIYYLEKWKLLPRKYILNKKLKILIAIFKSSFSIFTK